MRNAVLDCNRLVETYGHGIQQPQYRLVPDEQGNHRQDESARIARKLSHFAGAEGKTGIVRVLTRKQIGGGGDAERGGVGGHVPAIGQQRHRSEHRSRHNFADHHDGGQRDHEPGPTLILSVLRTEKYVVVDPLVDRM